MTTPPLYTATCYELEGCPRVDVMQFRKGVATIVVAGQERQCQVRSLHGWTPVDVVGGRTIR